MEGSGTGRWNTSSAADEAPELDAWLQRRFPGGGTMRERARAHVAVRVPVLLGLLVGVYLVATAATTRWGEVPGPRPVPLVVASVVLAAVGVVAGGVCLVRLAQLARSGRTSAGERRLLPALTWAERRVLFGELRGRQPVPSGDEAALAALVRARRQVAPLGWVGVGLLGVAASQVMLFPTGLLGALSVTNGIVAAALIVLGLRARADVRAGERHGLLGS